MLRAERRRASLEASWRGKWCWSAALGVGGVGLVTPRRCESRCGVVGADEREAGKAGAFVLGGA